jgi:hypothetical protein
MLSSYPERIAGIVLGCALAGPGGGWNLAYSAELYIQPEAEILVDVDSNRSLSTTSKQTSEGYAGQAGATVGYATPVSDTTGRIRLGYQDYPKDGAHEFQGTSEFKTDYNWERSEFTAYGQADRLNTFTSELASANFDPLVPISPTTPETGRINTSTTRTKATLVPSYDFRLTPRSRVGFSGVVESAVYSGPGASGYTSYTYVQGTAFASYAITPRADLTLGPSVSRDADRNGAGSTTGYGANANLTYKWSQTFSGRLELSGERDHTTGQEPTFTKYNSNAFGAIYTTTWTGQISSLQFALGRQLTPSGSGGRYFADQLQVEYDRKLSARLSGIVAARLIRYTAEVNQVTNAPYKYLDSTLGFKWLMTRTLYLDSGLQFTRIDTSSATNANVGSAANNFRLYLGFGYLGLGKRT